MKGYIIRQMLADNNIKVNDIAKQLGVTHVAVSKVIHRKSRSARVSKAIAEAVNRPVADLWPDEED